MSIQKSTCLRRCSFFIFCMPYFISGTNTSETMVISFIRMFMLGPEVSLNGSPTVSPTTAALCASLPLPPKLPPSMYFLALSHAPPELLMNIAISTPVTTLQGSNDGYCAGENHFL